MATEFTTPPSRGVADIGKPNHKQQANKTTAEAIAILVAIIADVLSILLILWEMRVPAPLEFWNSNQCDFATWQATVLKGAVVAVGLLSLFFGLLTLFGWLVIVIREQRPGFGSQVPRLNLAARTMIALFVAASVLFFAWTKANDEISVSIDLVARDSDGNLRVALKETQASSWPDKWPIWNPDRGHASDTDLVADLNSDRKVDLIVRSGARPDDGAWFIEFNNGSTFEASDYWLTGFGINKNYTYYAADVDADGGADLIAFGHDDGIWSVAKRTMLGFQAEPNPWLQPQTPFNSTDGNVAVGDVNGDGRADIVARDDDGAWQVALSNGSTFAVEPKPWIGSDWPTTGNLNGASSGKFHLADVDRDHYDDLIAISSDGNWRVALSDGKKFVVLDLPWLEKWTAVSSVKTQMGDINGDSRADLFGKDSNGNWFYAASDGTKFVPCDEPWLKGWIGDISVSSADR